MMPTVYIVDDDAAVRDSTALLLSLKGFATRSFASGEEFLAALRDDARGIVLLDVRMSGMDGLAVNQALVERRCPMPVVIVTAHGDVATARAALKAGAFDFLEKPVEEQLLLETVRHALDSKALAGRDATDPEAQAEKLRRLTPRELEVMRALARGQHNREIAEALGISPRTVEVYRARLMEKIGARTLADVIRFALESGAAPR
jgi:FixJ family two-component response regulator